MNEKLADKLKRLLALATLRQNEEGNEARENEARTAAFLLMKTCRDNEVTITFRLKAVATAPSASWPPPRDPFADAFLIEMLRKIREAQQAQEARERQKKVEVDFGKVPDSWWQEDPDVFRAPYGSKNRRPTEKRQKRSEWAQVKAKFPGFCQHCGRPFSVGSEICWRVGHGTIHERCAKDFFYVEEPEDGVA